MPQIDVETTWTPQCADLPHDPSRSQIDGQLAGRPRLRSDLVFRPQRIDGRCAYIVEDPTRTRFFRLGRREYLLAASLDGTANLSQAMRRANQALHDDPLSEQDAQWIVSWAIQNDLLDVQATGGPPQNACDPPLRATRQTSGQSPLCFRVPLGNPDPWLARAAPYLSWVYSRQATLLGLASIACGLAAVTNNWSRLVESTHAFFTPTGQLSLLVCWIALKAIHELSHGLACRRYGATVREAGLMFILFMPIAYVDVTSSWRIRCRWQRLHIAAAGMQLELYVASLAALVWSVTSPGIGNQLCANIVVMAGLTTLVFNANPLMRFDGYYILTDLLEMPNLAVTSQNWLRAWARRLFFGLSSTTAHLPQSRLLLTRAYGAASFAWRWLVCLGLIVAAAAMWKGAGIALAAFAAAAWIGAPLAKLVQTLRVESGPMAPNRRRFAFVVTMLVFVGAGALAWLPWPCARQAVGMVDYEPLTVLRTDVDGFVEQVLVQSGERVEAGQPIARLRNEKLQCDFAVQKLKVAASQRRIQGLQGRRELAALEAERQQLAALQKQLTQLSLQVNQLTLKAPAAGRVASTRVAEKTGVFLRQGDALLSLGSEQSKHIAFAIPQNLLSNFAATPHTPVFVSVAGRPYLECEIERVDPRATSHPVDLCLGAPFGGELLVRQMSTSAGGPGGEVAWELLEPHFTGKISLNVEQSERLMAGQRARIVLSGRRESLGAHLWVWLADWLQRRAGSRAS